MRPKQLMQVANLAQDLCNIFTDYAFVLDKYFESKQNKENHSDLYLEYQNLIHNLQKALQKNGFDKL